MMNNYDDQICWKCTVGGITVIAIVVAVLVWGGLLLF